MKSYGTMEGVYINGAPQGITLTDVDFRLRQDKMSKLFCAWFALKFHETDNFTLYPCFDNQHQQESLYEALLYW